MPARLIAIADECEADGGHALIIETEGGAQIEVIVPLRHVEDMIQKFQGAALKRANQSAQNASVPTLELAGVHLAHKGPRCELMVSTIEMGAVVLIASDECLGAMKKTINEVLSFRGPRPA
jgi:hypothetical protein